MAGKYIPLECYFKSVPQQDQDFTLSFDKVEQILGGKLPASAYQYQAWWANEQNGPHNHARCWLNAGWRMDGVDFQRNLVRFVRSNIKPVKKS